MEPKLCVITGDLIGSTTLPAGTAERAMAALQAAAAEIAQWQGGASARFTPYRGDGWQMVLHNPALGLRAALFLRARLRLLGKAFATRMALGEGAGALGMGEDLSGETGPAFVASGRALDAIPKGTTLIWAHGGAQGAALRLADQISTGWTPAQARAVALLLPPGKTPHSDVAQTLGISRQAVDQAVSGAGYPALKDAIEMIEAAYAS